MLKKHALAIATSRMLVHFEWYFDAILASQNHSLNDNLSLIKLWVSDSRLDYAPLDMVVHEIIARRALFNSYTSAFSIFNLPDQLDLQQMYAEINQRQQAPFYHGEIKPCPKELLLSSTPKIL